MSRTRIASCVLLSWALYAPFIDAQDSSSESTLISSNYKAIVGTALSGSKEDNSLVSTADNSAIVRATQAGTNPFLTPLSTTFVCYDNAKPTLESIGTLKIDGSQMSLGDYSAVLQSGPEEGEWSFTDNTGESGSFEVNFDEYGQTLSVETLNCYQTGARHEAALHQFDLNTPDSGEYACVLAENNEELVLEIIEPSSYRIEDETGSYKLQNVASYNQGEILFLDGPIANISADYYEDAATGIQFVQFTESSSYSSAASGAFSKSSSAFASCTRVAKPKPFKTYGSSPAPSITEPSTPIEGVYFIDDSNTDYTNSYSHALFVEYQRSGHFVFGAPAQGGTDCSRTRPNGLPYCASYESDGKSITITTPEGQSRTDRLTTDGKGSLRRVAEYPLEPVGLLEDGALVGTWINQSTSSSDISMCIMGYCHSSTSSVKLQFDAKGRFLVSTDSSASNTTSTTGVNTSFNAANSDAFSGTYEVDGNQVITIEQKTGEQAVAFAHMTRSGKLALGELQFVRE